VITVSIPGKAADEVDMIPSVENPTTPDEMLFARYWNTGTLRRYGKGSRFTLTAPAWVFAWVADMIEINTWTEGADVEPDVRKACVNAYAAIESAGVMSAQGPTRAELIEAGLVEAEPVEVEPVVEVAPVVEKSAYSVAFEEGRALGMDHAEAYDYADTKTKAKPVEFDQTDPIDNALTNRAHSLLAAEEELQERIDANGGVWALPAVFDLEGNMVRARMVDGEYGRAYLILDENGRGLGWFNPSKAKTEERRLANDAKVGFYLGKVAVPVKAKLAGGNMFSVMPIVVPLNEKYTEDTSAKVVDNGQQEVKEMSKPSKKRMTKVVHADGTVSTRSSETRSYLYAVEVTENRHEKAYELEDRWTEAVEKRDRFAELAADPKVKRVRDKKWQHGERHDMYLHSGVEGDSGWWLGTDGGYRDHKFDLAEALESKAENLQRDIDRLAREIDELLNGPEIGYGVVRWSETYPAAQTGLRDFERHAGAHRKFRIVECDVV
jgi:hypothetical protein